MGHKKSKVKPRESTPLFVNERNMRKSIKKNFYKYTSIALAIIFFLAFSLFSFSSAFLIGGSALRLFRFNDVKIILIVLASLAIGAFLVLSFISFIVIKMVFFPRKERWRRL